MHITNTIFNEAISFVQESALGKAASPASWIATAEVTLQIHLEHNGFNIYANEIHMGFVSL